MDALKKPLWPLPVVVFTTGVAITVSQLIAIKDHL